MVEYTYRVLVEIIGVTTIRLDAVAIDALRSAGDLATVVDAAGVRVGYFVPEKEPLSDDELTPRVSLDELDRRAAEGGGRSLKEIQEDWKRLS